MKVIKALFVIFLISLIFANHSFAKKSIYKDFTNMIAKGELVKAKEFIIEKEKIFGGLIMMNYYIKLGSAFLKKKLYTDSLFWYDKALFFCRMTKPHCDSVNNIKNTISSISKLIADSFLLKRNYNKALKYYKIGGFVDMINIISFVKAGDDYLLKGEFKLALENYEKSGFIDRIARCYGIIADDFVKKEKNQLAKPYYKKAVEKYLYILKSYDYIWLEKYNKDRLRCISKLKKIKKNLEEHENKIRLKKILKGAGKYSAKLRDKSIYFYCSEYVKETRDYSVTGSEDRFKLKSKKPHKRKRGSRKSKTFINSYQLIQKGESIKETRQFIRNISRKNKFSRKINWKSASVVFKKLIFGPLGMLEFSWQPYNNYKIIGEEIINNEKAVIIECIPEFPLEKKIHRINNYLFGKIWINKNDFSVLKIEWEPKSVAFVNNTLNSVYLSSQTRYKYIVEYSFKKNSIRFPTTADYSEYFVNKKGEKNIFLSLAIKYSDFRFFNVETKSEHTIGEIEEEE